MKNISTALSNHLKQSSNVEVNPRLIAEWNLNRYHRVQADNTPAEDDSGFDIEVFSIDSIYLPNRPKAGIAKAITDQSYTSEDYETVPEVRYYLGGPDDQYKYWVSPEVSGSDTNFALHTDGITKVRPRIEYFEEKALDTDPDVAKGVTANMIRVGIENSWARPDDWDIQYKNASGTWVTVATNPTVSSNGQYEFYYNGSWSTTPSYTGSIAVYGVRLIVRSMDKASALFSLIELSANLVRDLSSDLIRSDDGFDLGETDFITPIGTLSSNTGSVSLFNEHQNYTQENAAGPYYNMLDRNVKFTLYYDYNVLGSIESVQEFVLYSDVWSNHYEDATTDVELIDYSHYFQEIKPAPVMYQDISVQEAVWRICDLVGFNNYALEVPDDDPSSIIDIFYTTGEETVWEVFQELSRSSQCAIYFDSSGTLQIKTRKAAFNTAGASVWTFRKERAGSDLEDIVSLASDSVYDSNKVIVNYTPAKFEEEENGYAKMEVVWEPESTLTLRSDDLQRDIDNTSTNIWLNPKDAKTWPFEGVVNIEGEFIRYKGRRYHYYDPVDSTVKIATITSLEEQRKYDDKTPYTHRHLNRYNGALVIEERAIWNSEKRNHTIDLNGWTKSSTNKQANGTYDVSTPSARVKHNKGDGTVTINNNKHRFGPNDYSFLHRGNTTDVGYWHLGTRLKFNKGRFYKQDYAGIAFNMDGGNLNNGYFVEITPTINLRGKERKEGNELRFYSIVNGDRKYFGGDTRKVRDKSKDHDDGKRKITGLGEAVAVVEDVWAEIDINFSVAGNGDHDIQIFFNGRPAFTATVPNGSGWQHSRKSRFALFARGRTSAKFEYVYAINNTSIEKTDADHYLDRIEGGWYGEAWLRDWVFEIRTVRRRVRHHWKKIRQRYDQRFFDEFGPIVHEVREMDVKYDVERPVLQSRLYITNDTQAACPEFQSNPWGAQFVLCNVSRQNAVLNGDDELTNPGNTTNQKTVILGRPITTGEVGKITRKDDWAIKRRGEIEVEFDNKWVQSKDSAERLADWIVTQWARGVDEYTVEVFGNPAIELGDIVTLYYNDIAGDRFFVTGVSNAFEAGIATTLKLRHV